MVSTNLSPVIFLQVRIGSDMASHLQLLFILALFLISPAKTKNYNPPYHINTPFQQTPGLYFEHLATARLITNHWNILTYFNVNDMLSISSELHQVSQELLPFCKEINITKYCILENQEEF